MTIEWNRVTWYSKILAVVLFVATFLLAFLLGVRYAHSGQDPFGLDYLAGDAR